MKTYYILISAICFITVGCGSKELTRADAERMIRSEFKFPRAMDRSLFLAEPAQVSIASNSNLDEQGFLAIAQDQSGNPIVKFTEKADSYLLPTSDEDRAMNIQKVKVADEDLVEVTGIKTSADGKRAVVEFTTGLKNFTPLRDLLARKLTEATVNNKVDFVLYDDGWRVEQLPANP